MSLKYSNQHPKWIIENRIRKLHWFHNNPTNITAANMMAVRALV
jgi:hypothetical protein